MISSPGQAIQLVTNEIQVSSGPTVDTRPTLGADPASRLVVYTRSSGASSDVVYQRYDNSGILGPVITVSTGTTSMLNDVSGDSIVYTSFTSATLGFVRVYSISFGSTNTLSVEAEIGDVRIFGTQVVWVEGSIGATRIMTFDLDDLGKYGAYPTLIAGPIPPTARVEIGNTLIVWEENNGGQSDVSAYDLRTGTTLSIARDPARDEFEPSTAGSWVSWSTSDSKPGVGIEMFNVDTRERRVVVDNGALNYAPSMDGNFIAWEGNAAGNFDIYLYAIPTVETWQLTVDPADQQLNNLFGSSVAYSDSRDGGASNIYVTIISFLPDPVAPIANAGVDQTVHAGSVVTLDGSASSDPDGSYPLSYAWTITSLPAGSMAVLSDLAVVNPSFTADFVGDYSISLVVTDASGLSSAVDSMVVSTENTAPVADAGPDQVVTLLGSTVELDGSASWDDDGDSIYYSWTMITKPATSIAAFGNPESSVKPMFVADVQGDYVTELVVDDGLATSVPDLVTVSFNNIKPVANAGGNQSVAVGDTVTLVGSGTDANGDPLTYYWSFVSLPMGSAAMLSDLTVVNPSFTADVSGSYVVSLVVNDDFLDSDPANINVTATTTQNKVINTLGNLVDVINSLDPAVLKNSNMANSLTNKINAAIQMIDQGLYQNALDKLEDDILGKSDGCETGGSPDRNDWIRDCLAQEAVYPIIMNAINLLRSLL